MWKYLKIVILITVCQWDRKVAGLWDNDSSCPMTCTCGLEHLRDSAIHRFIQNHKSEEERLMLQTDQHENNDVFYEDDFDKSYPEENPVLRTVTCILQTETDTKELLGSLPKNIESLTLIVGSNSGNKSLNFSSLQQFENLIILELQGTHMMGDKHSTNFICNIDIPLPKLKYSNLNDIIIRNIKHTALPVLADDPQDNPITFEYKQQLKSNLHPLTMVQSAEIEEVLSYKKYKEQEGSNESPLFIGFKSLVLLRITKCELNSVRWEMFEGLSNLEYLILDKNDLMFIPDFAFYGTPNLKMLSLAWNNLLNIQVTDLAGLLELEYLDLSHNNFSQLSELSFPPFPKLKLANFGNNPICVVFPSTFEVMNTTDSLILGGQETPMSLLENSFLGLKLLFKLTLRNLVAPLLKRELITGMPNLKELVITGDVTKIEYDTFLDSPKLQKLMLAKCNMQNLSMDAFMGLQKLEILDLSHNNFQHIPAGVFDGLEGIKELYLNDNKFFQLERDIFRKIQPKMIRLNNNPWHCSCKMSDWKPMIINKIKQKSAKACDFREDKGIKCNVDDLVSTKYIFDNKVAPKCATPRKFLNWSVFHAMRKQLRCPDYKPKHKKTKSNHINNTTFIRINTPEKGTRNIITNSPTKFSLLSPEIQNAYDENGNLNYLHSPSIIHDVDTRIGETNSINLQKSNNEKLTKQAWKTKQRLYKFNKFPNL